VTTLLDVSLKVAREVEEVIEGAATSGSITTLADTTLLANFPDDHFNKGILWIRSGTQANKILAITDFATTTGLCTFASLGGVNTIAAADRYAIARASYPWDQIVSAIERALASTWVTGLDSTLTGATGGDGTTLEFTLPTGVYDVKRVELQDSSDATSEKRVSTHWRETHNGKLRFDYGYSPYDGDTIHIYYRDQHPDLTAYTVTISNEINVEWLKWASAQELLWWGVSQYGSQVEYRIEERMNKVIAMLKGKTPRRSPDIILHSGG
jgi:hypothetical protein